MTWFMVNLVLVCLEMVLVLVQGRCTVCAKRTLGSGIVLHKTYFSKGMRLKWMLFLVRLAIVIILTLDMCTICAKCTIA
jgi:hypothetical protein